MSLVEIKGPKCNEYELNIALKISDFCFLLKKDFNNMVYNDLGILKISFVIHRDEG